MNPRDKNAAGGHDIEKRFVFDSYAVLTLFFGEKASSEVKGILSDAQAGKAEIFMHWNNVVEVYYIIRKQESQKKALEVVALLKALPIQLVEFDEALWLKAAELKGTLPISLADAFVAATAEWKGAVIVTGDPEFEKLQDQFSFHWLSTERK